MSPHGECFGEYRTGFMRTSGLLDQKPRIAAKQPLPRCLDSCRINVSPLSRDHFPCQSFNVIPGRIPMCEFFHVDKNERSSEERHWKEIDFGYFYEKTCFKIPKECEHQAFIFDLRRDFRLKTVKKILPDVSTESECEEKCLENFCKAGEFDHNTRSCALYEVTRRENEGETAKGVNYFESACNPDKSRCPGGRVDFVMARHSDVASFGVQSGSRSIRDCMRECVSSDFLFCRSLQYDPKTNECFISEDASEVAVPSSDLDLFEPICLPQQSPIDQHSCNRPYAFEKLLTTKLLYTKEIQTLYTNDENFDYYEVACEGIERTSEGTVLIGPEKTLVPQHRQIQHVHIATWDECKQACQRAVFGCRVFSFSATLSECHLSADLIERSDDQRMEINVDFDVFILEIKEKTDPRDDADFSTPPIVPKFHHPTLIQSRNRQQAETIQENFSAIPPQVFRRTTKQPETVEEAENALDEEIFASSASQSELFPTTEEIEKDNEPTLLTIDPSVFDETTTSAFRNERFQPRNKVKIFGGNNFPQKSHENENENENENANEEENEESTTKQKQVIFSEKEEAEFLPDEQLNSSFLGKPREKSQPPPRRLPQVNDPETLEMIGESMPRVIPLTANVGHVPPGSLKSRAECHENGVNITFEVTDAESDYTGAVYAAERFSQCRVFVKSAKRFSIFVPRPEHNTWCNALEVDGVLSVVIVMSNDRVLPHDVTTKDDLFYQVTCNYSSLEVNEVQKGLVVGGPSPISIRSRQSRSFSLQIMQGNQPVESVFIGEKLRARVRSDTPASRLRVTECTATRVGGQAAPATVQLIADGCALMPSIMGPMRLEESGWEATLNAFRIDGSEQIDIVCLVVVCQETKCPEANLTCLPAATRPTRSLLHSAIGESIQVDSRLEVLGGDREALHRPSHEYFPELCIHPSVYLSLLTFGAFCMISLGFCLCFKNRKRKFMRSFVDRESDFNDLPPPNNRYRRQPSM
ncbi:unnamed protein product, partial [Mesorhabditis belari]|uniref:Uncharacterized protein n=1 Tax=Mesorhabditis belari TaxID=2138241 RepID=A0AAF3FCU5_9BILA